MSLETINDPSNLSSLYFDNHVKKGTHFVARDRIDIRLCGEDRGRGMIAKQDLKAGECLFVLPPTVAVPVERIGEAMEGDSLEHFVEEVLLQEMQKAIHEKNVAIANSFLVLEGSGGNNVQIPSLECLLGLDETSPLLQEGCTKDELRQIIRRNAFGPDFWTYTSIVRNLPKLPHRILGLYPLADMMNHSCQANTVRVFVEEYMVVHTSTTIAAGEEIVSSYVPPTFSHPQRQANLKQNHGFTCICRRCRVEAVFWENPTERIASYVELQQQPQSQENVTSIMDAITFLEDQFLPSCKPNELQRSLRLGFTPLYMSYLNQSLLTRSVSEQDLLRLCMQLHFGFVSCNPSSTEHLSILHLAYELIGQVHSRPGHDQSKTLSQLRFWTEQLKQACMIRYGGLGQNIDSVRKIMQHTRLVLRTPDGLQRAMYPFI